MRGAPRKEARAEDAVAAITPASTSHAGVVEQQSKQAGDGGDDDAAQADPRGEGALAQGQRAARGARENRQRARDPKDSAGAADGVTKILLLSGTAGKTKAQVKGKGINLPDPVFANLPPPVTAQLVNTQTAVCFEAEFEAADVRQNDSGVSKALSQ